MSRIETNAEILNPLYCDMQPFSEPAQIAHVAARMAPMCIEPCDCMICLIMTIIWSL